MTTTLPPYQVLVDSVHVDPESRDQFGNLVPAHFDTVLAKFNPTCAGSAGTKGYCVAQVWCVFTLPEAALLTWFPHGCQFRYFTYIKWFTPFSASQLNPASQLYKISQWIEDGKRKAGIILVDYITQSIHLIPKFGPITYVKKPTTHCLNTVDSRSLQLIKKMAPKPEPTSQRKRIRIQAPRRTPVHPRPRTYSTLEASNTSATKSETEAEAAGTKNATGGDTSVTESETEVEVVLEASDSSVTETVPVAINPSTKRVFTSAELKAIQHAQHWELIRSCNQQYALIFDSLRVARAELHASNSAYTQLVSAIQTVLVAAPNPPALLIKQEPDTIDTTLCSSSPHPATSTLVIPPADIVSFSSPDPQSKAKTLTSPLKHCKLDHSPKPVLLNAHIAQATKTEPRSPRISQVVRTEPLIPQVTAKRGKKHNRGSGDA
ncbi:hypothetical protein NP233_g11582 [Leucocoprinus birnbaumii]|uniref:Uncharacterized protein n=1 Tax=Leucocoprinus birnbaumii TaxID=56174 RepID=A0AAD5VGW4_9AGAR|nr:hypothetical protein NP233_g11582 [Leucocoprinus birnbaumii]